MELMDQFMAEALDEYERRQELERLKEENKRLREFAQLAADAHGYGGPFKPIEGCDVCKGIASVQSLLEDHPE